eukprot:UN17878
MDCIQNGKHSEQFEKFVYEVAKPVNIKRHNGFSGEITEKDATIIPYYSHFNYELALHVPTLCTDADKRRRMRLYSTCCVRVIWSESEEPMSITEQFRKSHR